MRRALLVIGGCEVALLVGAVLLPLIAVGALADSGSGSSGSCEPVAQLSVAPPSASAASDPDWAIFLAAERDQETGSTAGDYAHDSPGCQGAYCWLNSTIWYEMAAETGVDVKAYPAAWDAPALLQDQVVTGVLYPIYKDHGGGQAGFAAAAAAWNGGTTSVVPNPALGPGATNYTYANEVLTKMATLLGQPTRPPSSAPDCPGSGPSAGSYANPLRAVDGLVPERIDQGVDYAGSGPIYAIGPGVVESVHNDGWPDGVFIAYELEAGPDQGQGVYVAEELVPKVNVGQQVNASTALGTLLPTGPGIETGWADLSQLGITEAMADGQAAKAGDAGGVSTGCGQSFNNLLISLGAPGAVLLSGSPATTTC